MTPVRWGILSTALIAREKIIPAMQKSGLHEVSAIASRSLAKAQTVADEFGIGKAYGAYEAMLLDPQIEAVYNPLPNELHVPMTLAALKAGKHVLCEKPMSVKAADLALLRPYASLLHIREAFMVRHHPQWLETRALVREGAIGELRYMQVPFSYFNDDPHNIRNRAEAGSGAAYDIGCYAITAGRWFFEANPERVIALVDRDPRFHADRTTSALLDFGHGRQLAFSVCTQAARYQRVQIVGTKGRIEIEVPFNAPENAPTSYHVHGMGSPGSEPPRSFTLPAVDQYQLQMDAFARAVRSEPPDASGLDDALANMRVIEALFASEKSGRFERP
jgi:predicted dehydrogenase